MSGGENVITDPRNDVERVLLARWAHWLARPLDVNRECSVLCFGNTLDTCTCTASCECVALKEY